jgi:NurA-like 5'-3' nuclease
LKIEESDVARLEFPIWVAQRDDWLDQIHALTLAQIEKGDGYPLALMEAHEQAVVRGEEREMFYALLEELMMKRNLSPRRSSKNRSKARPLV